MKYKDFRIETSSEVLERIKDASNCREDWLYDVPPQNWSDWFNHCLEVSMCYPKEVIIVYYNDGKKNLKTYFEDGRTNTQENKVRFDLSNIRF
jgi:hypothetical protein